MMRLVLLAALPQEYAPLKKRSGPWRRLSRKPLPTFRLTLPDKEILLVETGMGRARILDAFDRLLASGRPDLVVSIGFAGSLCRDYPVAQTLLGGSFALVEPSREQGGESSGLCLTPSSGLEGFCRERAVATARIVTASRPEPKKAVAGRFSEMPSAMDMESYFAAEAALEHRVPFLCFRSISDGAGDEIDFDLESIMDSNGRVRIHKVLTAVFRRPRLVGSFYASWKRSGRAADALGKVLADFLGIPAAQLEGWLSPCRLVAARREEKGCP